ncbi:MAG: hypothetical protein GY699_25355 [Desulfobacteraceae bacterium]|nr:hypothetical protein [Desulfobacteraceae bacterium]
MGKIVQRLSAIILISAISVLAASQLFAADRMFFGGLNSQNLNTGNMDVVVVWGELEGKIPSDVSQFKIYRKAGAGSYTLIKKIGNALLTPSQIRTLFEEPGEEKQKAEIITMLSGIFPDTDINNYYTYLHNVMDQGHPEYNPLQKQFLARYSRNAARAQGRAFIDRDIAPGSYTYMITGVLPGDAETNPLGRFEINTASETILPEPEDFEQVRVGFCSDIRKNVDHARIHLNWKIPVTPELMSIRSLIYGYDIYRATSDLGTLNLHTSIPSGLEKINELTIIASGNAPSEGLEAFLSKDDNNALTGGPGFEPGDAYYYYLVARDLAGSYSQTAGPLKAVVPDTRAPVVPWNVHGQREYTGTMPPYTPRLTLLWDQVNNINYLKQYSTGKQICDSSPDKVCHVQSPNSCESINPLCVDLDVVKYLVYRFDSFKDASHWGSDSDGDRWPDELEDKNEDGNIDPGETDPCDPLSHPGGTPPNLITTILQSDASHIRTLASGKKIMVYQDPVPAPDNKVYWYRISTVDPSGNASPLSPPARASLWDRSQPDLNGKIKRQVCDYVAKHFKEGEEHCERPCDGEMDILTIIDETGLADHFKLYEVCKDASGRLYNKLIYSGSIKQRRCLTRGDEIDIEMCRTQCDKDAQVGFMVQFFGRNGLAVESNIFELTQGLCYPAGCVVLFEECRDIFIPLGDPGYMPPLVPGDPIDICVTLEPGECAKIYQKIQGKYSPVKNFCNNTNTTMEICDPIDFEAIVSMDICLGLRIFSKNHVGSGMGYFQCIPLMAGVPQPPLLESVEKSGTESSPTFELKWSAQSEGIAAFIIQRKGQTSTFYETVWDIDPDPSTGQYVYKMPISPAQIEDEWCFKVKAVDSTFQMSNWSSSLCAVWGEIAGVISLKWPHVSEPSEGDPITAFYMINEQVGAIVLSEDLSDTLEALGRDSECYYGLTNCIQGEDQQKNCLKALMVCNCNLCGSIDAWNDYDQFVVYRQEENKNYIQVSPLVEKIHCEVVDYPINDDCKWYSAIADPLVYLLRLQPGSIGGVTGSVKAELENSERLVFIDWYPHKAKSKVRYHLMKISKTNSEPEKVFTSDWIEMN